MRLSVHILIYRTFRCLDLSGLNGCLEFILGRLHQRRVEGTTHLEHEGTLGTSSLELLASLLDSLHVTRDHELTWAVIVSGNDDALTHLADLSTYLFDLLVGQGNNGCHRRGLCLTGLLHGHCTGIDQLQTILETQCASSCKGRKLSQRVSSHHLRIKSLTHAECRNHTMKEDCRLCHLRLLQVFVCAIKHDVRDAISQNVISFLKKFLCKGICIVKILTHAYKLCSLSGKNKCFHLSKYFK